MRKYIHIILSLAVLFVSCYDDDSTRASIDLDLNIDVKQLGNPLSISEVNNGQEISLETDIITSLNTDQFKYEWRLSYNNEAITASIDDPEVEELYETIGNDKDIQNVILFREPNARPYNLWLFIKDQRTGAEYNYMWRLRFLSSSGDGVLIADTYDGQTSDLTLIRSKNISSGYKGDVFYKRNVIEGTLGTRFGELIHTLYYGPSGKSRTANVFALMPNDLKLLSRETYQEIVPIDRLFTAPMPSSIRPKTITKNQSSVILVNQDDIHLLSPSLSDVFGAPINYVRPGSSEPKNIANEYLISHSRLFDPMIFFDNSNKDFAFFNLRGGATYKPEVKNSFADDLSLYEVVGSGVSTDLKQLFLLKGTSGSILIYRILIEDNPDISGGLEPVVTDRFQTTACPDITNAFQYEVAGNRDVVFYATKNKVYSAYMVGNAATGAARFTPPSGEEVVSIKIFHEAWHKIDPNNDQYTEMPQNQNQLLVATYNESKKEGKLYVLPITGLNGALGEAIEVFDGFGKITAIETQGQ